MLGDLGGLYAQQGRRGEARAAFDAGEAMLRSLGSPFELSDLLRQRAILEHLEGNAAAARAALSEAEALAAGAGVGPDGLLGRDLAETRALLDGASARPAG